MKKERSDAMSGTSGISDMPGTDSGHSAAVTRSASAPPLASSAASAAEVNSEYTNAAATADDDILSPGDNDLDWLDLDETPAVDTDSVAPGEDLFAPSAAESPASDDLFAETDAQLRAEQTTDFDDSQQQGTSSEEIWLRSITPMKIPRQN